MALSLLFCICRYYQPKRPSEFFETNSEGTDYNEAWYVELYPAIYPKTLNVTSWTSIP